MSDSDRASGKEAPVPLDLVWIWAAEEPPADGQEPRVGPWPYLARPVSVSHAPVVGLQGEGGA